MSTTTANLMDTSVEGATPEQLLEMDLPETFKAAYVEKEDAVRLWEQPEESRQRADVRDTLKVGQIPMPEPAPDEVVVAVMPMLATASNFSLAGRSR